MRPILTKEFLLDNYINSDKSLREFSTETGWHIQTICQNMRRCGIGRKVLGVPRAVPVTARSITKEYLQSEYVNNCRTTYDIADEHGVSPCFVQRRLKRFGLLIRTSAEYHGKIAGQRFGRIVVSDETRIKEHNGRTRSEHLCECDCGQFKWIRRCHLVQGATESCGCLEAENLLKIQDDCKTGYGEITGSHWARITSRAKVNNIECNITIIEVWELFEKQNRKCALTGHSITMAANGEMMKSNYSFHEDGVRYASLDRIDSKLGYIHGNVQWVWGPINIMKSNFTQNGFISFCKDVVNHSCAS